MMKPRQPTRTSNRLSTAIPALTAGAAILLLLSGCATRGSGQSGALRIYVTPDGKTQEILRVNISSAGVVQVGDRVVGFPKMVEAVREAGATRKTGIELVMPPGARADLVLQATRMLRKAGYGKLVFTTGKQREETSVSKGRVSPRRKAQIRRGER